MSVCLKLLALTSCDLLCDHITSANSLENPLFIENTSTSVKIQMAFLRSFSTISQMAYSAGKIETLGSIFRHEIRFAKLLPSLATLEKPFVFVV